MGELYFIATELQENNKDEAEAVSKYTKLLDELSVMNIDYKAKKELISDITEIISDELNHQEKLKKWYVKITNIEPNKE